MSQPSIKKNYIFKTAYELLLMITPLITAPYISRVLGVNEIGNCSFTASIMSYFTLIAGLGTSSYGMREIARCRNDRKKYSQLFWEIELLSILVGSICFIGWIILVLLSENYKFYFLALSPLLLSTMMDISWFFTGHELIGKTVFKNAACKLAGIILLFILVKEKSDVYIYVAINSIVHFLGNASMWAYLPHMLEKVEFKNLRLKNHFHETLIYFIPAIATSVYTILDKTLIGLITNDSYQNGCYEQANKIISICKTITFTSVNAVLSSRISYLFAENKTDEIHSRIEKSISFIFLIGYGCLFGILAIAQRFVPVFFGSGYDGVTQVLRLMSPLIIIIGVSNCLGSQYYTPAGLRKESAKFIIYGSIVNLIMNLLLIPKLSAIGAVIGSILAETLISVLYIKNSKGYLTLKILWKYSIKRIVSGVIMMLIVFGVGNIINTEKIYGILVQIIVGIICYVAALIALKDSMIKEILTLIKNKIKSVATN